MTRTVQLALALSLAGVLAACGSGAPKNTAPISKAAAETAADAALSDLAISGALVGDPYSLTAQQVQALRIPGPAASALEAAGMNLAQAVSAQCKIDIGNWTDVDLDFIPANFTITVSNCSYTDGNLTYSFEGGLVLNDTNDGLKDSGFDLRFNNFKEQASNTAQGKSFERTFNGNYKLDTQNKALYKVDKGYGARQVYTEGGQTDTRSADYGVNETYAPTSVAAPKAGGTFTIDKNKPGSLVLAHNNVVYRWAWYTEPPLVYDRTCKARTPEGTRIPFTSGAAIYTYTNPDGKVSRLEIAFTGCNQYTVKFEGQNL